MVGELSIWEDGGSCCRGKVAATIRRSASGVGDFVEGMR